MCNHQLKTSQERERKEATFGPGFGGPGELRDWHNCFRASLRIWAIAVPQKKKKKILAGNLNPHAGSFFFFFSFFPFPHLLRSPVLRFRLLHFIVCMYNTCMSIRTCVHVHVHTACGGGRINQKKRERFRYNLWYSTFGILIIFYIWLVSWRAGFWIR